MFSVLYELKKYPGYPRILILLFFLIFMGLFSGCAGSLASDVTPPQNYPSVESKSSTSSQDVENIYPLLPPDPSAGQAIFADKCAPCHGVTGMGDGVQSDNLPVAPPRLGDLSYTIKSNPANWFLTVTSGNIERFMPGFTTSLTDRQRWDVVAYLLTLSVNPDQQETGKLLYTENCLTCHGEYGLGVEGKGSSLNKENLLQLSLEDISKFILNGTGNMPPIQPALDEFERLNTAIFTRSLAFSDQNLPSRTEESKGDMTVIPENRTPVADVGNEGLTITGRIINGSGFPLQSSLRVKLTGYDAMQEAYTDEKEVTSDGSFNFIKVPESDNRVFLLSTVYKDINFTSEIIQPGQGVNTASGLITIYETSTDKTSLRADRLHLFFDFSKPGFVQIVQMYVVNNPTDYMITGDKAGEGLLEFILPEGASNLDFQGGQLGQRFIETKDGFSDTRGIPPGSGTQILFAYDLPYQTDLHLLLKVPLPVDTANIMLPSSGISIKSSQLQDVGERNIQGVPWKIYVSGIIPTGDQLDILLSGKPRGVPSSQSEESGILVIGLVVLGLTLLIVALVGMRWRNNLNQEVKVEPPPLPMDSASKEAILDTIIALDDQYQNGQIPRLAYEDRRNELKIRLRELI